MPTRFESGTGSILLLKPKLFIMKSIAFQDVRGGCIRVYNPARITKNDRIKQAFNELRHTTEIKLFLVRGKKIRKIAVRRFNTIL